MNIVDIIIVYLPYIAVFVGFCMVSLLVIAFAGYYTGD